MIKTLVPSEPPISPLGPKAVREALQIARYAANHDLRGLFSPPPPNSLITGDIVSLPGGFRDAGLSSDAEEHRAFVSAIPGYSGYPHERS